MTAQPREEFYEEPPHLVPFTVQSKVPKSPAQTPKLPPRTRRSCFEGNDGTCASLTTRGVTGQVDMRLLALESTEADIVEAVNTMPEGSSNCLQVVSCMDDVAAVSNRLEAMT